jgi:hypothetical protein
MNVFIQCHKCGDQNCIESVPPRRVDLAVFRGSMELLKCKGCRADLNPGAAYCGVRVEGKIVPCADPTHKDPLPD